jgi:hypothetical protein
MAKIHWAADAGGDFNTAADWVGGAVPGAADDAILDPIGTGAFTVTVSTAYAVVNSIQTAGAAHLIISGDALNAVAGTGGGVNAGSIAVDNRGQFVFGGTLDNSGLISLNGVSLTDTAQIIVKSASTASLTGGGQVVLTDSHFNYIDPYNGAGSLTNVDNTITGAGRFGGSLSVKNGVQGVIDATGAVNPLDFYSGGTLTNAGLLESTGLAGMGLAAKVINTGAIAASGTGGLTLIGDIITNGASGQVDVAAGSQLVLQGGTIIGGELSVAAGGSVVGSGGFLAAATFTNLGVVTVVGILTVQGVVANSGSISLNDKGHQDLLIGSAGVTLTGGGTVRLSDDTTLNANYIAERSTAAVLTNTNNTIAGAGQIGFKDGKLTLVNQAKGVIDATAKYIELTLATGKAITNAGLIESTGGGGLFIDDAISNTGIIEVSGSGPLLLTRATVTNGATGRVFASTGSRIMLVNGGITGGAVSLSAGSTLIATGTTSSLGAATLTNRGTISVGRLGDVAENLTLQGSVTNFGSITVNSQVDADHLLIGAAGVTLAGAGKVILTDNKLNLIEAATAASLTNINNTISGAGAIGGTGLSLINEALGVIDATGTVSALTLDPATLTNAGLVEATGSAGLVIADATVVGVGIILAATGSKVTLANATVAGGTLAASGGGTIGLTGADVLDASAGAISLAANLNVNSGATLTIDGSISNSGTLSLAGASLLAGAAGATLASAGHISLSDNAGNFLGGTTSTAVLTNLDNTISGSGKIGGSGFVNGALAVIDATGAANALTLNPTTLTNAGRIEATGSAGLVIAGATVVGEGVILAATGSKVKVANATIAGGTLTTSGSGVIDLTGADAFDGTAGAISLAANLTVANGATLTIDGSINNAGTLSLAGAGTLTALLGGTLAGGGHVSLSDTADNFLGGTTSTAVLANLGNTISGSGTIGGGGFVNGSPGVIDATGASYALTLDAATLTNTGLLEATGAAGLVISHETVQGAGGIISAGAGSKVSFQNASLFGVLAYDALNTAATGVIAIGAGCSVGVQGALANAGTIALEGATSLTDLRVLAGGATLSGGGTVSMTGPKARIFGTATSAVLTNVDDTIAGTGFIGLNEMGLVNEAAGVIDASAAGSLLIATKGEALTNAGLIEASGAGVLIIEGSTISNAGGTIAAQSGARVELQGDDVRGGSVGGAGTVLINAIGGEFDGTAGAVTVDAVVEVLNGKNLILDGTLDNTGAIETLGSSLTADLIVGAAGVMLTGGGTVKLANGAGNRIYGQAASDVLTNLDNVISGAGQLGNGALTLVNGTAGVIHANQTSRMTIDTGTNTIDNAGLIETSGGGGLTIISALANTGTLLVSNGTLTVEGTVTGSGTVRISGGTADFVGAFGENVTFTTTKGVLELAHSQSYTGHVAGLASGGTNSLDLLDIGFTVGTTTATFSGTTSSGTLTVTGGGHTAKIFLVGDYLGHIFTASSDGHGGTRVVDPIATGAGAAPAAPQTVIQAMAGFAAPDAVSQAGVSQIVSLTPPILATQH